MNWIIALGLAVLSFVGIAFVFKAARGGWQAVAAALGLGMVGYALQASPGMPGAPKAPAAATSSSDAAKLVEARRSLENDPTPTTDKWLIIGDALARNGQFADAAGVLLGAVEHDPKNADAWLALANSLVAHADGTLSPAALYAYRNAIAAAPEHPGPPFFLGLAMAQSGQLLEARAVWARLLDASPADAPWRADLAARLQALDAFIASRQAPAVAP